MFGFLGIVFVLVGLCDLVAGYFGTDIWDLIPVELPLEFTQYSAYILIGVGVLCIVLGRKKKLPQRF